MIYMVNIWYFPFLCALRKLVGKRTPYASCVTDALPQAYISKRDAGILWRVINRQEGNIHLIHCTLPGKHNLHLYTFSSYQQYCNKVEDYYIQIHLLFRHSYLKLQGISHKTQSNKGNYITNLLLCL